MFYLQKVRFHRYDWLSLACVAFLGLIHLPIPFHTDQALFVNGALALKQGAVLYRDFWDYKTPGIFLFYLLGCSLFGFTEIGIHIFELLYQLVFSAILILTLRPYYQLPIVASFAPVFTVGLYYSVSTFYHMTEVEGLVGFPLFLCLWFAYQTTRSEQPSRRWLIGSGLMGGIVLYFKFVFSPILLGLWLFTLIWAILKQPTAWFKLFLRFSIFIGIGILIPVLPGMLYFAHLGLLDLLYQTFLDYPSRILSHVSYGGIKDFQVGFAWFVQNFAPAIGLGVIGTYAALSKRIDFLTLSLVLWFSIGFGLVLFQKTGWWPYYYFILIVPIGLLAAKGVEVLCGAISASQPQGQSRLNPMILVGSLLLIFGAALEKSMNMTYVLLRERLALTPATLVRFQETINPEYRGAADEVAWLAEPHSLPGKIYIVGHPLMYLRAGRPQAIAYQGMAPRSFLPEQWVLIRQQLEQAKPPYIYIKDNYAVFVAPVVFELLDRDYIQRPSRFGTWYVRRQESADRSQKGAAQSYKN